jgi:hypothetical protein
MQFVMCLKKNYSNKLLSLNTVKETDYFLWNYYLYIFFRKFLFEMKNIGGQHNDY